MEPNQFNLKMELGSEGHETIIRFNFPELNFSHIGFYEILDNRNNLKRLPFKEFKEIDISYSKYLNKRGGELEFLNSKNIKIRDLTRCTMGGKVIILPKLLIDFAWVFTGHKIGPMMGNGFRQRWTLRNGIWKMRQIEMTWVS
jgi:hypothetical protein